MRPADQYFSNLHEPVKSCILFSRNHILSSGNCITEEWKYKMPFYCINGKMFCYLWVHKKFLQPYLGIVEGKKINHPELLMEKRSRMKILLVDPARDIPLKKLDSLLKEVLNHYNS